MQVVVFTDESLKAELLNSIETVDEGIVWVENLSQLEQYKNADAIVDLLYNESHRLQLESLLPALIVINSVEQNLQETNLSFVRINGWKTFLQPSITEASTIKEENKTKAQEVFSFFQKKLEWVPDEIGFITPRVVSMIINEAFIALKEGVSTKGEIDTAMKLGTNYPYGPFEWAEKIGVEKIKSLLDKLSMQEKRYASFVSV
ncbi:MAG TPA: 3-hydroxyacyl-CoA dehydrogenase family protein [Flavisolibacter sp.]|nr:3-hydroxyacyl-CoA dehydrogenase family protein [Flavisolibacter sp.]